MKTNGIPWLRIGAESTAIIISILLAFSIDAWWDNRQNAASERVFLQSLLEDLERKQELLRESRIYIEAIRDAITSLLKIASESEQAHSNDEVTRLLADTWWYNNEASWDSAPMRALSGGNAPVITNPALRQKLGDLQITISRLRNFLKMDENFHHNVYTPYLISHADMPLIASLTEYQPGDPDEPYSYPNVDILAALGTQDHLQLVREKEFQNIMIAKLDRMTDILISGDINGDRALGRELDEIVVLIRQELGQ